MKKIASTGDLHWDSSSPRWAECNRIHAWVAEDMRKRGVSMVLINGDWYERLSKIAERIAVCAWLQVIAAFAYVLGVKGNHDNPGDLQIFNQVKADHSIFIEESVSVRIVDGVAVALIAWPQKARLLAELGKDVSYEESEAEARRLLRTIFLGVRDQLAAHDGPRVVSIHTMISGAITSVGQPLVGSDLEQSLQDLAQMEADIIFCSHIHKPQDFVEAGIPIVYCGSLYATTWGETEEKSYVIAEFNDKRDANGKILNRWYRVPTPRTPMVLLEATYNPETQTFDAEIPEDMKGADVRFRYNFDSEFHDAAAAAGVHFESQFREAGATEVKVEGIKNATARARAPEIVQAVGIAEKLPVLWKVKGTEPPPDRASRLLSMAGEIENERLAES